VAQNELADFAISIINILVGTDNQDGNWQICECHNEATEQFPKKKPGLTPAFKHDAAALRCLEIERYAYRHHV
jgi:hypothetical protein